MHKFKKMIVVFCGARYNNVLLKAIENGYSFGFEKDL
jgi:hypothetical protein